MSIVYCIGAVNLDIIADSFASEGGTDRRGNFTISIGGTAFNVATNLAFLDTNVILVTALKKDSLLTAVILDKIKELGITVETVYPAKKDSIFLAFRENKNLKFAVNSTPVEEISINRLFFTSDVKGVFVDFNNSVETICNIVNKAHKQHIPVFTNLVSETKTRKLLNCPVNFFTVISCNIHELKQLLKYFHEYHLFKNPSIYSLSRKYSSPYWLITSDCDGASLWHAGECVATVTPPEGRIVNYSGAGDAMIAGFMYGMIFYKLSPQECLNFANQTVRFSLQKQHANLMDSTKSIDVSVIYKDRLTGLPTRAILDVLNLHGDYCLLVLDIDHFKKINDTYGHKAGDEVLKTFASILRRHIRKNDHAIRWGGEEFVVILHRLGLNEACRVAERIRETVERTEFHISHPVKKIHVTCSIGLASTNETSATITDTTNSTPRRKFQDVFSIADENLYKAKNSGRNRVVAG